MRLSVVYLLGIQGAKEGSSSAKLCTGQLAAGVFRQRSVPEAGAAGRALERHVIKVDDPAGPDVAAKVAEPGGEIVARDCHR
jgi:hypothetical protein